MSFTTFATFERTLLANSVFFVASSFMRADVSWLVIASPRISEIAVLSEANISERASPSSPSSSLPSYPKSSRTIDISPLLALPQSSTTRPRGLEIDFAMYKAIPIPIKIATTASEITSTIVLPRAS